MDYLNLCNSQSLSKIVIETARQVPYTGNFPTGAVQPNLSGEVTFDISKYGFKKPPFVVPVALSSQKVMWGRANNYPLWSATELPMKWYTFEEAAYVGCALLMIEPL